MSKNQCNDCKTSSNSPHQAHENRYDLALVLGWFNKLNVVDQKDLIRELYSKVQGISIEMLPSESEEDFRLRSFERLFERHPSSSQRSFGFKVFKAYVRTHGHSNLYRKNPLCLINDESIFNADQLFKVKSLDNIRKGSKEGQGCIRQVCSADEESLLKLELFKVKTFDPTEGAQGGQGSRDHKQQ